jgi:predicted  nucleic acid-binding Zn-ribbon protein
MNKDLTQTLLDCKERIANNEKKLAKIEGQLETLQKEMDEKYKCKSIEELEALLKDKLAEFDSKEAEYKKELKGFEDKYGGVLG